MRNRKQAAANIVAAFKRRERADASLRAAMKTLRQYEQRLERIGADPRELAPLRLVAGCPMTDATAVSLVTSLGAE